MIGIYDFMAMDKSERAEAVWLGEFLGNRTEGEFRVLLYSLGSFHVEVYYQAETNEIMRFRPFKSLHPLAPYLAQIDFKNSIG